ncbi:MAG TPA: 16S rRNA processing protein RimM [Nautiliaceae bacterium]|nr:16S rRNA processing protein RimM [Nautiliaceae bacterium]
MKNKIPIAKIGKTYGTKGWQKIHLLTDFPEQFKKDATFESDKTTLTIENIDLKKGIVKFKDINSPEEAKKLTNRTLYTTKEKTKEEIKLKENEYFWFDIIGCDVYENDEFLGKVKEIQRINESDYLLIETNPNLNEKYPKRFLIDFKRNVKEVDIKNKKIFTTKAKELLDSLI